MEGNERKSEWRLLVISFYFSLYAIKTRPSPTYITLSSSNARPIFGCKGPLSPFRLAMQGSLRERRGSLKIQCTSMLATRPGAPGGREKVGLGIEAATAKCCPPWNGQREARSGQHLKTCHLPCHPFHPFHPAYRRPLVGPCPLVLRQWRPRSFQAEMQLRRRP